MSDHEKTKEQFIVELQELRRRVNLFAKKEKHYKLMEESLRASDERYRALFVNNPIDTVIVDEQARVVEFNQAKKWFGGRVPEIGDVMYRDYAGKHDIPMYDELIECIRAGLMKKFPEQKYGDRYLHINMAPFPGGAIITSIDITERKRVETALRETEERFREMSELLPQIVFETDEKGRLVFINQNAFKATGYNRNDLKQGVSAFDLIVPEDRERARKNFTDLAGKKSLKGGNEYIARRKDGSTFLIMVYSSPVMRGGNFSGARGIIVDITEQKQVETELIRAEKLESIGLLAGGIAHDFNNMLTAIMGNISLAKVSLDPQGPVYERLEEAENASRRAHGLSQQLLTFSKGGKPIVQTVEVDELLREASSFALRGSNVRCEFTIPEDLWPAELDIGQFSQVIRNLVINADQSMPDGGILTINARNTNIGPDDLLPLAEGRYIKISLADQGEGIYKKDIAKIFDPYFSTKEEGSGLGLAVVYSIVKKHRGHIAVESKRRSGSTFNIWLPASEMTPARREKAEGIPPAGSGRILVMDDEESVRNVVAKILASAGYETELVKDGQEVLDQFRKAKKAGQSFDAVLLDLTVPGGMGGMETIENLLKIDPGVRAIVSSGYGNDMIMANFREYGFSGVVPKPYTVNELCTAVNRVISYGPAK